MIAVTLVMAFGWFRWGSPSASAAPEVPQPSRPAAAVLAEMDPAARSFVEAVSPVLPTLKADPATILRLGQAACKDMGMSEIDIRDRLGNRIRAAGVEPSPAITMIVWYRAKASICATAAAANSVR